MRKQIWLGGAALAAAMAYPASVLAQETSVRTSAWSDDRRGLGKEDTTFNLELWGRGRWEVGEGVEVQAEGWASIDPAGDGEPVIDIQEANVAWRVGGVKLTAGRQLFAWGRADRLNPTDVLSARDQRRLVDDDNDMRLGIAAVSAEMDVGEGTLSLIWAPEFRATRVPVQLRAFNAPLLDERPKNDAGQFAIRYEQFGQAFDWSATYAEALDRTPWLRRTELPTQLALTQVYPKLRMLGGDLATTIGEFGVRAEAAIYDYDRETLREAAARAPKFALALGADRDFPGQLNVNVQALVRVNQDLAGPPDRRAPLARANASLHYTWRDTVVGGLVRVRQPFDEDRGAIEVSVGGFSGGGTFQQLKVWYALADGVRLTAMGERYGGAPGTQLGRLAENSLFTVGIRYGY